MLKDALSVSFRSITAQDFLQNHRKGFIRALHKILSVKVKDVILVSAQVGNSYHKLMLCPYLLTKTTFIWKRNRKLNQNKPVIWWQHLNDLTHFLVSFNEPNLNTLVKTVSAHNWCLLSFPGCSVFIKENEKRPFQCTHDFVCCSKP